MSTLTPKKPKGEKVFAVACYILGGLTLLWVILSALEIGMSQSAPLQFTTPGTSSSACPKKKK